jgi:hypothetical protein
MQIRKDDRNKTHHKVAMVTGSFLLVIIGVTLLGMHVFSPSTPSDAVRLAKLNRSTLIGSPEAQAADGTILPDLDEKLDGLADTLDEVITDARDTNQVEEGAGEPENEGSDVKADLETAVEAGKATWSLWTLLWEVIWPKVSSVAGAIWGALSANE